LIFQDGTERPIERPKDPEEQTIFYSGKKNDKKIADETSLVLPAGSSLAQDTGFQGYRLANTTMIQPMKKPRGKELTPEQKENNCQISSLRIWVEHAIGGVKPLPDCQRYGASLER
jgi:hypothetical protein